MVLPVEPANSGTGVPPGTSKRSHVPTVPVLPSIPMDARVCPTKVENPEITLPLTYPVGMETIPTFGSKTIEDPEAGPGEATKLPGVGANWRSNGGLPTGYPVMGAVGPTQRALLLNKPPSPAQVPAPVIVLAAVFRVPVKDIITSPTLFSPMLMNKFAFLLRVHADTTFLVHDTTNSAWLTTVLDRLFQSEILWTHSIWYSDRDGATRREDFSLP